MRMLREVVCEADEALELMHKIHHCSVNPGNIISMNYNMRDRLLTLFEIESPTHIVVNGEPTPLVKILTLDELEALLL